MTRAMASRSTSARSRCATWSSWAPGGAGTVSAAVGNPTGEAVTLTFATAEANGPAQIPAHSTVDLSKSDTKVVLSKVDQAPAT